MRGSGTAEGTLSRLGTGSGTPAVETVFSLTNALKVPVSALPTEREEEPEAVPVRSDGLEVFRSNAVDPRALRRTDVTERVPEPYGRRARPGERPYPTGHPAASTWPSHEVLRVGPPDAPL